MELDCWRKNGVASQLDIGICPCPLGLELPPPPSIIGSSSVSTLVVPKLEELLREDDGGGGGGDDEEYNSPNKMRIEEMRKVGKGQGHGPPCTAAQSGVQSNNGGTTLTTTTAGAATSRLHSPPGPAASRAPRAHHRW
uniref:Uncharacterized protein n=1 Tax=Oryza nivara TaxID=4536 RepID=A0A0E0IDZ6_ORYNI